MLRKTIATVGVAAIVLIATPTVAFAAPVPTALAVCTSAPGDTYVDGKLVTTDQVVVEAGGTFAVSWNAGYFTPDAPVTVTVTGADAAEATIALGGAAAVTGASASGSAAADGSLGANVTLPASATGTYSVQATSDGVCGGLDVTVEENNPAGVGSETGVNADADGLAATGGTVPTVLAATGIAALLAGAVLMFTRARRRLQA